MTAELERARRLAQRVSASRQERDDAIRAARAAGHTLRAIGDAVGLSHQAVKFICDGRGTS